MDPESCFWKSSMVLRRVVLPQPLGPNSTKSFFSSISKLILSIAWWLPYFFDRFSTFKNFAETFSRNPEEANHLYNKLLNDYKKYTVSKIVNLKPINGSLELLNNLKKKKKKIYINSATPINSLLLTLNGRKITHYFDKILGVEQSKKENLKCIQKHSKSEKKSMLMIGDGQDDLKAAEEFKIKFYPVGTNLTSTHSDFSHLI